MNAGDRADALLGSLGYEHWRPGSGGGGSGAGGARFADRDAHRWGEEPLLPAAGAGDRGPDDRGQPADRVDAGPVAAADRGGAPGGDDLLGDGRRGGAGTRSGWSGAARRGSSTARRSGSRRTSSSTRSPQRTDRPDRGRRGALRLRVGARLPARLPAPAADRRAARAADGDGLHGDRDQAGGGGDRRPASGCATRSRCAPASTVPTSPSTSSRSRARAPRRGARRCSRPALATPPTGRRSSTAAPASDTDEVAAALREAGRNAARLPRRDGSGGADRGPAPLHGRRGRA